MNCDIDELIIPTFKISTEHGDYEFEVLNSKSSNEDIESEIDDRLNVTQERIDSLDVEIERLTADLSKLDILCSIGSGIISGLVDILYVGVLNLDLTGVGDINNKESSYEKINQFIQKIANKTGYIGDRLNGAISHLEDIAPVAQDNIHKLGISSNRLHHLEDLAHHPTPLGLVAALCVSFLNIAIFTNKEGNTKIVFVGVSKKEMIKKWSIIAISGLLYWFACWLSRKWTEKELSEQPKWVRALVKLGASAPTLILIAKIAQNWALHEVSDMGGSKNTSGGGMGIPGLYLSLLKELAMFPPFNSTKLNEVISTLYSKKKIDFRMELSAVSDGLGKQMVPIILNEILISGFYFISRLIDEYKRTKGSIATIDWWKVVPYGNRTIVRMRTIASGTFTAVDMVDAAIRSYLKSGGEPCSFITNLVLRVNVIGIGRLTIAIGNDIGMGLRKKKMRKIRMNVINEQLYLYQAKLFIKIADIWNASQNTEKSLEELNIVATDVIIRISQDWSRANENVKEVVNAVSTLRKDENFENQLDGIL